MIRRSTTVAVVGAALLFGAAVSARFAEVTFVMKNGQRVSGTFRYNHTNEYQIVVDGRERSYPSDDIAMVAFVSGDPQWSEVSRLPESDNVPELERHTLVRRNGEMIRGKIYDFRDDQLIMDIKAGDRRTYGFGDIARLYISASGARGVFRPSGSEQVGGDGTSGGRRGRGGPPVAGTSRVRVEGNVAWTDTRLLVNRGDQLRFQATGEVQLAPDTMAGPAGKAGAFPKEVYPVTAAPGALIGRIGNGRPFLIGGNTEVIAMPAQGTLMLGVNDNVFTDNGGGFDVRIQRIGGQ